MAKKFYEIIEHTADVGIRVRAKDLKGLFKQAARAMFDIVAEVSRKKSNLKQEIKIHQKADSLDELFVNWLNELLSLSATKELIFSAFKISKIDEKSLEAAASGSNMKDCRVNVEIKAATYHELKIKKDKLGWSAQLIFDV